MNAEADKLSINKLVNVSTSLNNLKIKVDDLDLGKLKTVPVDLKKLSDAVDNEIVKNTKFNTLKTKVNNLENKIPDAITLIHINQYKTDKQNLEKKIGYVDKKCQIQVLYLLQLFLIQKLVKLRTKFLVMIDILQLLNLIS